MKLKSIVVTSVIALGLTMSAQANAVDWHPNGATHLRANGAT